jgi:hypothetical protein
MGGYLGIGGGGEHDERATSITGLKSARHMLDTPVRDLVGIDAAELRAHHDHVGAAQCQLSRLLRRDRTSADHDASASLDSEEQGIERDLCGAAGHVGSELPRTRRKPGADALAVSRTSR